MWTRDGLGVQEGERGANTEVEKEVVLSVSINEVQERYRRVVEKSDGESDGGRG